MAKKKKSSAPAAKKRAAGTPLQPTHAAHIMETEAPEPTGACRYTDGLGGLQCESPVTKSQCDAKGGDFTPDDRCD